MSWRQTQLGQSFCDQDRLILELFGSSPVKYVSRNLEFAEHLNQSDCSENLILIINQPIWCSELITLCKTQLTSSIKTFYIGVNRYCIKGNDTTVEFTITEHKGKDIIDFIDSQIQTLDYSVKKSGHFDQDLGRYFNFVQPITWLYGNKTTN